VSIGMYQDSPSFKAGFDKIKEGIKGNFEELFSRDNLAESVVVGWGDLLLGIIALVRMRQF
jgi:hypothetical protein